LNRHGEDSLTEIQVKKNNKSCVNYQQSKKEVRQKEEKQELNEKKTAKIIHCIHVV